MAKKTNSKSVRMTDEVLTYVESMEGDGFNQKFENMVLYAMKTEEDRKRQIQYLDDRIAGKQAVLDRLREYLQIVNRLGYSLKQIESACESLIDDK
ncbi:hypothetical protein [Ruminococcus gauvreauii]|uniref:hypothetical protein n=1 Tax=Ruminococcus gauvreauii TaxID=438033 RepID=UPI003984381D